MFLVLLFEKLLYEKKMVTKCHLSSTFYNKDRFSNIFFYTDLNKIPFSQRGISLTRCALHQINFSVFKILS